MVQRWAAGAVMVVLQLLLSVVDGAIPEHLVKDLPGLPPVNFQQYAGYLTANETTGRNLFYWFFTADHENPSSLPLAIWFNGGPGCSSVGDGLLQELGPFYITSDDNGRTVLELNSYSWIKAANMVFLEAPVGVGFSYSDSPSDYTLFTDKRTAEDNLQFLLVWLEKYPEYKKNDFYLVGESYAGHYVPTLAKEIVHYNENKKPSDLHINFKGFAIGNPWTDAYANNLGATEWWYSHSLISPQTYEAIITNCDFARDRPVDYGDENPLCNAAVQASDTALAYIDAYSIYTPTCNTARDLNASTSLKLKQKEVGVLRAGSAADPCTPDPVRPYLNSEEVKNALHVRSDIYWTSCSDVVFVNYSTADILESMVPIYIEMMKKDLKIWIYSGDTDSVCPTTTAEYSIKAMNLTVDIPWYPWNHSTQVGGYTEVYKGLTYTTVRNAGHFVPSSQPGRALALFKHFLAGTPLPAFQ
ncbi:hypothetical protein Mapa_000249 [Marchantia paleacea]|nr:hypothetical protein Mapa_000249 [Marchantia paleacea]